MGRRRPIRALDWYSGGGKFSKLNDLAEALDAGFPKVFFGWLGWVLLALVVLCAIAANLPLGAATNALRIVAPVLGAAGIALTLLALNSVWSKASDAGASDVGIFKHSSAGLYLALAGFLVAGIAGVLGPRRG